MHTHMHTHTLAVQVADIMLMMRQEEEPPSNFLSYTVVAVVAVAGHLMKASSVCVCVYVCEFVCVCVIWHRCLNANGCGRCGWSPHEGKQCLCVCVCVCVCVCAFVSVCV
jgi:hypothetical protein